MLLLYVCTSLANRTNPFGNFEKLIKNGAVTKISLADDIIFEKDVISPSFDIDLSISERTIELKNFKLELDHNIYLENIVIQNGQLTILANTKFTCINCVFNNVVLTLKSNFRLVTFIDTKLHNCKVDLRLNLDIGTLTIHNTEIYNTEIMSNGGRSNTLESIHIDNSHFETSVFESITMKNVIETSSKFTLNVLAIKNEHAQVEIKDSRLSTPLIISTPKLKMVNMYNTFESMPCQMTPIVARNRMCEPIIVAYTNSQCEFTISTYEMSQNILISSEQCGEESLYLL